MKKETEKIPFSCGYVTRTKTERPKEYKPPSSLDAPHSARWIQAQMDKSRVTWVSIDTKNIHGRLRSGYELVRADEYSDARIISCCHWTENTLE